MFQRSKQGAVDLVRGGSPINRETLEELEPVLAACAGHGQPRVVLDLAQVPLFDGAGLERLLDYRDLYRGRGGALKLGGPNALCRDILRITGLAAQFEVYDDALAAVGSFAR